MSNPQSFTPAEVLTSKYATSMAMFEYYGFTKDAEFKHKVAMIEVCRKANEEFKRTFHFQMTRIRRGEAWIKV